MHIRKGDTVEVICGDDANTRGTVLSVDRKNGQLVVEGVNKVYKHVRRGHPKSPQGGRLHTELKIDASNVMLICPQTGKPTRVGVRFAADGTKELYAKRSGAKLRDIAPPKKKKA
jgi:large subunit ribosomal protein L24